MSIAVFRLFDKKASFEYDRDVRHYTSTLNIQIFVFDWIVISTTYSLRLNSYHTQFLLMHFSTFYFTIRTKKSGSYLSNMYTLLS